MFTNDASHAALSNTWATEVVSPGTVAKPYVQPERTSWGLRELSRAALRNKDFPTASYHLNHLCHKAEQRQDLVGLARSLCDLAFVNVVAGHMSAAEQLYQKAHDVWGRINPCLTSTGRDSYSHFLWDYSIFLRNKGNIALAVRLEAKLDLLNANLTTAQRNFHRAEHLAQRGQYAIAQQLYEDALVDSCLARDTCMQIRIADRLSSFYHAIGRLDLAEQLRARKNELERVRRQTRLSQNLNFSAAPM